MRNLAHIIIIVTRLASIYNDLFVCPCLCNPTLSISSPSSRYIAAEDFQRGPCSMKVLVVVTQTLASRDNFFPHGEPPLYSRIAFFCLKFDFAFFCLRLDFAFFSEISNFSVVFESQIPNPTSPQKDVCD